MSIEWITLSPAPVSAAPSADAIVSSALARSAVLRRLLERSADRDEPILLLVNDPERSTQTRPVLSALAALAPPTHATARFRVLVATGTHRFDLSERSVFESATFEGCGLRVESVDWHDARDEASLVPLAGVRVHRLLARSRLLLPVGSVEPHYFAGLTGPHKTVTIGCLSRADIERNHAAALDTAADILRLEGNPIHAGVVEILRGLDAAGKTLCAVGQVVRGERLVACAAGFPLEVLDALRPGVERIYHRRIDRPADILRLRVPPPLGRSLYQADKALKNNHRAVRDGGAILLEADCPAGVGPDAFLRLLRQTADHASALRAVRAEGYRLGDHKAVRLRHLMDPACRGVHVAVVSPHLPADALAGTGIPCFPTTEAALEGLSAEVDGPIRRGLLIEDAGMLCVEAPRLRDSWYT